MKKENLKNERKDEFAKEYAAYLAVLKSKKRHVNLTTIIGETLTNAFETIKIITKPDAVSFKS